MTDSNPAKSASHEVESDDTIESEESHSSSKPVSILLISFGIPVLIVLGILAYGWFWVSSSDVDREWLMGKATYPAPPGTTLAGIEIGGITGDEIDTIMNDLGSRFGVVSVWLTEADLLTSVVMDDFQVSTVADEIVLSVTPMDLGLSLDLDAMRTQIMSIDQTGGKMLEAPQRAELWHNPQDFPLRLAFDEDNAREYFEGVKSTVDCEPVDAVLDLENQMIVRASDGLELDIDATLANIPSALSDIRDIPIELVISHTPPEIGNEAFDEIDIENPLAEYTTHFATYKRNRSYNIYLVSSHFEAVVVQPGEVLSFNDTTGERGTAEGYRLAPMYIRNRPELSPAGGACQVSTTLYNAALLAGLEPVERWPHSRPCSYVPYGRDATVAYDSGVDLSFRNNLDHPIILHQEVDYLGAGTITFQIFGHPDDRVYVEIGNAYSWIGRTDAMTTYIVDESLAPGEEVVEDSGVSGLHQRTWRIWYDENGNELYTEDLYDDRVRPVGALIRHNPAAGDDPNADWMDPDTGDSGSSPDENPPDEPDPSEPPPGVF